MFNMRIIATTDGAGQGATFDAEGCFKMLRAALAERRPGATETGFPASLIASRWSLGERMRAGIRRWFEANVGPVTAEGDIDIMAGTTFLVSGRGPERQRADVATFGWGLTVTVSRPNGRGKWLAIRRHILEPEWVETEQSNV